MSDYDFMWLTVGRNTEDEKRKRNKREFDSRSRSYNCCYNNGLRFPSHNSNRHTSAHQSRKRESHELNSFHRLCFSLSLFLSLSFQSWNKSLAFRSLMAKHCFLLGCITFATVREKRSATLCASVAAAFESLENDFPSSSQKGAGEKTEQKRSIRVWKSRDEFLKKYYQQEKM